MKQNHILWFAGAVAAGTVTLIALGASPYAVLLALFLLVFPVVIVYIMEGHHGHGPRHNTTHTSDEHDHPNAAGRP